MPPVIEAEGLTRVFPGHIVAVDRVSFAVEQGEIFGFLGPNGAGKSTTIMMLTTLLRPTAGTARVAGFDVVRQPERVRASLGYVSQDLAVDDNLTGIENLTLQARLYHLPRQEARRRIAEVLQLVGLAHRARDRVETYSGGMRKRLDIAAGLLHRPKVLFLDEPTLGLDIQTRREIWRYVRDLRANTGMTVFLTTHYMEEADVLCDRVAIIDRGQIKAVGRPSELKAGLGGDVITLRLAGTPSAQRVTSALRGIPFVADVRFYEGEYVVTARDGEKTLPLVFEALQRVGEQIVAVTLKQPSLDDVYLAITGRGLRDDTEGREDAIRHRIRMRRIRA
ncbi:MAG TPA: ABC transporter ATP-binding protein [Peptococcaceae bacterium]|nr:ABC transporter ATP-binding protein [Peptococcaceae bacterium]